MNPKLSIKIEVMLDDNLIATRTALSFEGAEEDLGKLQRGFEKEQMEQAENIKKDFKQCEKCGGELGEKMIGDECYDYCKDCNWVTS